MGGRKPSNRDTSPVLHSVEVVLEETCGEAVNQPCPNIKGVNPSSPMCDAQGSNVCPTLVADGGSATSSLKSCANNGLNQLDGNVAPKVVDNLPDPRKSWRDLLFNSNREELEEAMLEEVGNLEDPLVLEREDFSVVHEKYQFPMIGFVAGKNTGRGAIITCCNQWRVPYQVQFHESGWVVVNFEKEMDRDSVIANGPYMIYGRAFMVKVMPELFYVNASDWCKVPIWVKLPGLTVKLWNKKALSKICSKLGKPIRMDKVTLTLQKKDFARVLVEVDVSKTPVNSLYIKVPNGGYDQYIEYEHVPLFCTLCKGIGHGEIHCSRRPKEVEKPIFKTYIIEEEEVQDPITPSPPTEVILEVAPEVPSVEDHHDEVPDPPDVGVSTPSPDLRADPIGSSGGTGSGAKSSGGKFVVDKEGFMRPNKKQKKGKASKPPLRRSK